MPHFIIGTAGHVDHGKTALIKAMTGIDTDRLAQEKERGLSLDLGFAHLDLPSGISCGIVDVPGHERYLKNMLAGVGGYNLVLLVVDASESIKEQTREHFEIIQLMNVQAGIAVITKIDLVSTGMVDLVEEEVKDFLKGTFMENSPILRVSSETGEGLDDLIKHIDREIQKLEPRDTNAPFRLPIDRVFTIDGFGTVVTGTVYQGTISTDSRILVLPAGLQGKVRKIQIHGEFVGKASTGQRAALNLARVDVDRIHRGDQVVVPGLLKPTRHLDTTISVLKSSPHPLRNRDRVRFFIATDRTFARVILLNANVLEPGQTGYARLILEDMVASLPMDSFILRAPSEIYTIGGGKVLDTQPTRHRRFDEAVIEMLRIKEAGDPALLIKKSMDREPYQFYNQETVATAASISYEQAGQLIEDMKQEGRLYSLPSGKLILKETLNRLTKKMLDVLNELQKREPESLGRHPGELKMNLPPMDDRLFREIVLILKKENKIVEKNNRLSTCDFSPKLTPQQEKCKDWILEKFEKSGFSPPTRDELVSHASFDREDIEKVVDYLIYTDQLVALTDRILFTKQKLARARKKIGHFLLDNGIITPAQARNLLDTTRKYVIPLLEYLDRIYFTRRKGNYRTLFRQNVIREV